VVAGRGLEEPWRARSGTTRGSYSGDQGYSDAWGGGEQEVDCGVDGRAAARGEVLRRWQRWKQRSRGWSEVEEEGESPRTGLENLESSGVSQ
jgi:hypothetical protein